MKKKGLISTIAIISFISLMLVVIPQAKGTQFILASWDYPDEYGQGIHVWSVYSNATGSWVLIEAANWLEAETGPISWNVSQAINITIGTSLNRTLLGLNSTEIGRNHVKHNVTVTDQWDNVVFTQENFTFGMVSYDSEYSYHIYWYVHHVVLEFLPLEGEFYTVEILCWIYW